MARRDTDEADTIRARSGIQSLDAALPLLRKLAYGSGPKTLKELADATGMTPSKVHRYLASFSHIGLVTQSDTTRRYDLGPLAAEVGLAALSRRDFVNQAADGLAELTAETGLTALLSVWSTRGPIIIRWQRAPDFAATSFGLGSTLPVLASATGHVFLAFLPDQMVRDRVAAETQSRGGKTKAEAPQDMIRRVRKDRLAMVDGRYIPGLSAIASPILNWQGEIEAAVTLIGTDSARMAEGSDARDRLQAYASAISLFRESIA